MLNEAKHPQHKKPSWHNFIANCAKALPFVFKDIDAEALPWVYFNKMHDLILSREIGNEWKAQRFLEYAKKLGFKVLHFSKQRTIVYPHFTVVMTVT